MADYSSSEQSFYDSQIRAGRTTDEASRNTKEFSKAVRDAQGNLRGLSNTASSVTTAFKGLASGNASISAFGSSIGSVTGAIGNATKAFGTIGKVAGTIIDGVGSAMAFMVGEMDNALGSYQALSKSGFSGAEGIDTLVDNIVKSGIPLKQFSSMLDKNKNQLIMLHGSADKAADGFASVLGFMKKSSDQELRNLGFTSEEIGDTVATFVERQRLLGFNQVYNMKRDQMVISEGAIKLGKRFEEVSKLTGLSRDAQKDEIKQAMLNARYQASQRQLRRQGADGVEAADQIEALMLATKGMPDLQKAIQDASTGMITSEEAKRWQVSIPGFMAVMNRMRSNQMDWGTALQEIQNGSKKYVGTVETLARAVGDTGILASMNDMANLTTMADGNVKKAIDSNKLTSNDIANMHNKKGEDGKGADSITVELTSASKNLEIAAASAQASILSFETVSGAIETIVTKTAEILEETENLLRGSDRVNKGQNQADIEINNARIKIFQLEKQEDKFGAWSTVQTDAIVDRRKEIADELKKLNALVTTLTKQNEKSPITIGRLLNEKVFKDYEGIMGTGMGMTNNMRLIPNEFEKKFNIPANTKVPTEIAKQIRNLLNDPPKGWVNEMKHGEHGDTWDKRNWDLLRPIVDEWKKNIGKQNTDAIESSTQSKVSNNEKLASALNALSESNNESNKKLDSIVTALNQGNKNTQGIKQVVQMS